jgi:uncharacterized repeat protein (TIGR04052 family)
MALTTLIVGASGTISPLATAAERQKVTLRFAAKVGNQPFSCGSIYRLGTPAIEQTFADFRFYVTEVTLINAWGKTVPVALEQDGKWQYQNVALLDFEDKTGSCTNGTTELRDRVIGTVPRGNYTGLKFTLGIPFALNHEDAALAPSPLNLTGLWWNWQFGYKFARIDLQSPTMAQPMGDHPKPQKHQDRQEHEAAASGFPDEAAASGFPIHLGSTGCAMGATTQKPTTCKNPNRATISVTRFDPAKQVLVADLAKLVATVNLKQNQPKTAPGCMSEPGDQDCLGIMATLGLPFMSKPEIPQTFFRVE